MSWLPLFTRKISLNALRHWSKRWRTFKGSSSETMPRTVSPDLKRKCRLW